jgi:hypothetical protein
MGKTYAQWKKDGRPVEFGKALKATGDRVAAHGYTVYYIGNEQHLTHTPPEDHTPFSATGWPGTHPYPYILAMDIMPPRKGQVSKINGKPLPTLQRLSAQLYADKQTNVPGARFVKYMNWEPEANNAGPSYHETWTPSHARRSSSDRGHTHVSSRTDFATSAMSDGYDLVARAQGETDDMDAKDLDDWIASRNGAKDGTPESKQRNLIRAWPWQYTGGGIPAGMSTLGVLNAVYGYSKATAELVQLVASRDEVDEAALGKAIADSMANAVVGLALPQIAELLDAAAEGALAPDVVESAVRNAVAEVLRNGVGSVPVAPGA